MYKIIASDLDESLLKTDKTISESDLKSISKLKDCKLVIATGRGFESMQYILKQLNTYNKENEYTISFNGGVITENKNNKIIYKKGLTFDQINKVFELGLELNTCIEVFTTHTFYIYKPFENELKLTKLQGRNIIDKPDIEFLRNEDLMKIMFVNEDTEILKKYREYVNLEDEYEMSFSSNRYLEFNAKGVNKGNGLLKLCEILDVDIKDTISLGDNNNDIPMLKTAGLGICVANATLEAKKDCDVILESDNNHNPMTELINRFVK